MRAVLLAVLCLSACAVDGPSTDAGAGRDAGRSDAGGAPDSGGTDASTDSGSTDSGSTDAGSTDAGASDDLASHRDRILATYGEPCSTWASFDVHQRSVFLTITHRLFISEMPDRLPMIAHITRLYYDQSSDGSCGGSGNRLFLSMDAYLHGLMVDTWNGARVIGDGGGSTWLHTRDRAGPHDPFDASIESDVGLRCVLLVQTSSSRPPTAQAHFFLPGSEVEVVRGGGVVLPVDPYLLEIDQDYNCIHDSNPTCGDFDDDYVEHYGDFGCDWVPSACTPGGTGCYRSAS